MLELIDEGLESFFRATVPLSATDVDVSFEAPDREWSAKLTRPTVNVFLWDIRLSASRANSGLREHEVDGKIVRSPAPPFVELRYVISAWTSDAGDERALLSGLTRSLLSSGEIPREHLPESLSGLEEPQVSIARAGEDHMDVFKALEGQVKPGLNIVVTSEFDTTVAVPAGPPVTEIDTRVAPIGSTADSRRRVAGEVTDDDLVGAVVRSPIDATTVNPAGRFLLRAAAGDEIVIDADPPRSVVVPEVGGVRL